jgi:hypothetical protein
MNKREKNLYREHAINIKHGLTFEPSGIKILPKLKKTQQRVLSQKTLRKISDIAKRNKGV